MLATPPTISGYTFHRELGRGAHGVVYEASKGGERYAVKVLPASAEATMRREAAAMARLHHAALIRVFEVGRTAEVSYLVMELVRGDSLAQRLASGPLPEPELVRIARALAGALRVAHHANLVHRDIKPENVLLDADATVKLIDFGFAADAAQLARDGAAVGTFLYASPEQSGRLSAPVDARSDLYALGAALYHAAVGSPPYRGDTIAELALRHATAPIPDPAASGVSRALAAILQKLLAKDPPDRYQTARGLAQDLDHLDELEVAWARGELVLDRGSQRFAEDRASLVGRDRELAELAAASAAALDGHGSIALVEGEPGSGKSRLARELVDHARRAGRWVLEAKATEGDPLPFAALRSAFAGVAAGTRGQVGAAVEARAAAVRAAAGDALDLVLTLVPELAPLLGKRPALELGRDDREQAFATLSGFLLRLASEAGGLVMWLDDVQWLDDASLQVLRRVVAQLAAAPLWLLATQRDEPAPFSTLLGRSIATRVPLGPLAAPVIASIIGDLLGGDVDAAVVELVAARSKGNPLVVQELVRACTDAGVVQPSWGVWRVERAALDALVLPGDVLGLIGRRVDQLGAITRRVLSVAAVIGNRFTFDLVRGVAGRELGDHLLAALSEATGAGLIELLADGRFALVHDRIRENLLAELAPDQRREIHDRLAEVPGAGDADDDAVFAVAHHLAQGAQRDPRRTAEANLRAGLRALALFADDEALGFLEVTARMQRDHGLPPDPRHDGALGEAHLRLGDVELAVEHFHKALELAREPLERAALRERLTKAHVVAWNMTEACRELDLAYRELGEPSPGVGAMSILRCIYLWFASVVIATTGLGFGTIRGAARERMKVIAQLCDSSVFIGIMAMQTTRLIFGTLRMLHAARRIGPSRELVIAYGDYAAMMGVMKRVGPAETFARQGIEVARTLGERPLVARAMMNAGGAARFYGGEQVAEQRLIEALETHGRWLDADGFVFGAGMLFAGQLIRGYSTEALRWVDALTEQRGRTLRAGGADHPMIAYGAAALAQLGRGKEARDYAARAQACVHPADVYSRGILAGLAVMAALESDDPAALDRAIAERRALVLPPAGGADLFLRYFYVVQAYGRLRQRLAATADQIAAAQGALELAARELHKAAHLPVLQAHDRVIEAGLAMLAGDPAAALAHLEQAHHLASEADVPWAAFEALRMSARIRLAGNRGAALRDADLARAIANRQRWIRRRAAIEREFSLAPLHDAVPFAGATLVMPPDALRQDGVSRTLLELSLAAASVFDPEQQARVCLDHLVKMLGAERAYLFTTEPGGERLVFRAGRNADGGDAGELRGYSTTVVEMVRTTRSAMVVSSSEEGVMLGSQSAMAHDLRSILAGPLLVKDELAGVVYLDSRLSQGMFTANDVQTLAAISAHIAIALESARAAQAELRRQTLEKDLAVTGAVQALLLPRSTELAFGALELVTSYRPATVSGGDWWWADRRDDGSVLVLLGDATGHGAGAAMVTAAVSSAHRVLTGRHAGLPVGELLAAIHELIRELCRGEYLMSLVALRFDEAGGTVEAWSAGGPSPVIISASGAPRPLKLTGSPLGGDALRLGTASERLGDDERLFAFTDGAFEIKLPTGRTLGTKRLIAAAQAVHGEPLEVARHRIERELDGLRGGDPDDDTTFILVGRRGAR